jgi:GDP-4-dehydro-6-deoxy-D-mannose reductase
MKILITGITGFAGVHLAEALLAEGGADLVGVSRRGSWPEPWRSPADRVTLRPCDLCDPAAAEAMLRDVRPDQIYHLAGYAHVGRSFHEPNEAWSGNLTATRSLLEGVARWGGRPRFLYVGSGQVYGDADTPEGTHSENHLLLPTSPYAASKAAADLAAYQYGRSLGLEVVRARPYNHIGPGQSADFAVSRFAQLLVNIERGSQPPRMETGNLSARRDLTDVRDMVRAYVLLMNQGRPGEAYNIGTGHCLSMREVLDRLLALVPIPVEVRQSQELLRATDPAVVRADATKLRRENGWQPRFSLDQTLADMLSYWRQQS